MREVAGSEEPQEGEGIVRMPQVTRWPMVRCVVLENTNAGAIKRFPGSGCDRRDLAAAFGEQRLSLRVQLPWVDRAENRGFLWQELQLARNRPLIGGEAES